MTMTSRISPLTPYTPAEVARLSDQDGKLYELEAGVLVEKPMSTRANWVATEIAFRLRLTYSPDKAFVFVEQPTYCFEDLGAMRRPDVALVWSPRLPEGVSDAELRIAPDLVVEVVSPTNTYSKILDRVEDFQGVAVPLILVVEPDHRWIHVYKLDGSVGLLRSGATLKEDHLLPRFELKIDELFSAGVPTPPKS